MLTQARLKELLYYHQESGDFIRLTGGQGHSGPGTQAGSALSTGHIRITIDDKEYKAHRLAFLYMTGAWPSKLVDHRNGKGGDNSWKNLREATDSQNMHNRKTQKNSTGHKNISWRASRQHYAVAIKLNNRTRHIGTFKDLASALAARNEALAMLHTEFARLS